MKVEKLQALRVHGVGEGFHVLIVPDDRHGENFRDFYLVQERTGHTLIMFGCFPDNDEHAVQIAQNNAPEYINDGLFREVD